MRILIIDDYRESAQANKLLLEALGHEAIVAYDGASGIETALTAAPDAVLMDLYMPGLDGLETCRRLRALPALRSTIIVGLTGACEDETLRHARAAGFDLVVSKPVSIISLRQTLEALVAGRGATKSNVPGPASAQ